MFKSLKSTDLFLIISVFFIINPFIKVIPVHVEIQPIYTLFVFIGILFRGKLSSSFIIIFFILSFFLFLGCALTNFDSSALSTYLAVLSLLMLREYFCNSDIDTVTMHHTVMVCLYSWLAIGLLQGFFPQFLYSTGLDSLLSSLISRYSSEAIGGESARGIRLLAPEPSYAAHIIFFFFCYVLLNKNEIVTISKHGKSKFILIILSLLFVSWKNGSSTLFIMLILFISFIALKLFFNFRGVIIVFFSVLLFMLLLNNTSFLHDLSVNTRFGVLLERIFEQESLNATFKVLLVGSGQRMTSVFVGYWTLLNFESSYYFGAWAAEFYENAIASGLDVNKINYFNDVTKNVKPYSLISTLSFDLGWIGFAIGCYLCNLANVLNLKSMKPLFFAIYLCSLFAIFFNSPVALPTYLFLLYYISLKTKENHVLNKALPKIK